MSTPITPRQVAALKQKTIPAEVFDAFNEMIAKDWDGNRSKVVQKEVLALIYEKLNVAGSSRRRSRQQIIDEGWLDVETLYRKAGWKVTYDKPGYNEDYEASFTFAKK